MALEIDLSETDKRAHDYYEYPESDEALKQRLVSVASSVVRRFNRGGDMMEPTEEMYAVTQELRERGYEVSINVEEELITVDG